jgi:hypothetical protein
MVENKIKQIIIDNRLIGLVGLDDAIKKWLKAMRASAIVKFENVCWK